MQAIVQASKTSIFHRHNWTSIKVIGSAEYFKCFGCGAKKVIAPPNTGDSIRCGWLFGVNKTLKQSPTKKVEVEDNE